MDSSERNAMIAEAMWLLGLDLVIFDTETTGLGADAEVVEIAALKLDGTVVLDTLVKPRQSIPLEATAVHGISDEDVAGCARLESVLAGLTGREGPLASYNLAFDERVIQQSLDLGGPLASQAWGRKRGGASYCIMEMYAIYHGDWSAYHRSYTFQSLGAAMNQCGLEWEGHAHRAMGDAKAAAAILRYMAFGWA